MCEKDRLGPVGTTKYFSWLAVALILMMALSSDVISLFLTLSMATYFVIYERSGVGFAALCLEVQAPRVFKIVFVELLAGRYTFQLFIPCTYRFK